MTLRVPDDVVFRDLDGEGILLNLSTGVYFGLNTTGTFVWAHLSEGKAPSEIIADVIAQFEVTGESAAADVESLVDDLVSHGLLAVE